MKTTTYPLPLSNIHKPDALQAVPALAIGMVSAILFHRIALDGVFGISGARLPFALAGASAWLYLGFALNTRHPGHVLAHLGFGIALFVAALAGMDAPAARMAPWFLAQSVWVLMHRRDIAHSFLVVGWAAFTATLAGALAL